MPDQNAKSQQSLAAPDWLGAKPAEDSLEAFSRYRALLFSIAYRMLGSAADAEDMLQETFLRWQQTSYDEIRSPRAFLVTVISRLCIQHLESARVRREEYVGPWLPEPVFTSDVDQDPSSSARMHQSLSIAFLLLLEKLTPTERAVFLLREVFDYEYSEIAGILEKTEATCRQHLRRARERITRGRPRFDASPEQHRKLLQRFLAATSTGNLDELVAMLSQEIVLYSDGGGNAKAALHPVHGSDRVARFILAAVRKTVPGGTLSRIEEVNGQPSVIYSPPKGGAGCMITLDIAGSLIRNIYVVTNPEKLRRLARVV